MNRKLLIGVIAIVVLGVIAAAAAGLFHRKPEALSASGTLEARNIEVGSKVGGRVTQVLVQEGDMVKPNQLIVTFDDAELYARVLQARGQLEAARANLTKLERGNRPEDIAEAAAATAREGGYAVAQVQQARAQLASAHAEQTNAKQNYDRVKSLVEQGVMARQLLDDATARLKVANENVNSLENSVQNTEGRLRAAQANTQRTKKGFRVEDIQAAKAAVTQAEGMLKEAEARYAEREVRAPAEANVEVLDIRPGDLLPANARIAKLLESDQLYVIVYVPQNQIGRVRVGQKAQVKVDAFDERFPAVVEQIRQQAEFLPRNVQTKEERVHQVIGVKLRVDSQQGKLRAGVNAEVSFGEQ
jgi:multidrug resistance efflux pump